MSEARPVQDPDYAARLCPYGCHFGHRGFRGRIRGLDPDAALGRVVSASCGKVDSVTATLVAVEGRAGISE